MSQTLKVSVEMSNVKVNDRNRKRLKKYSLFGRPVWKKSLLSLITGWENTAANQQQNV